MDWAAATETARPVLEVLQLDLARSNSAVYRLHMASSPPVDSRSDQPEIDSQLHDVAYFVHEEFDGKLDPRVVDDCLFQVASRFEGASVRVFVPLLVRRYVREDLKRRLP